MVIITHDIMNSYNPTTRFLSNLTKKLISFFLNVKPCNVKISFVLFNKVPASYCGLYSRYSTLCIIENVKCEMPLMYIVIYPEYVTRTKAIVNCCILLS